MLTYLNFDLRIQDTGGRAYSVMATAPPGSARGAFKLPFAPETLSRILTDLRTLRLKTDEIQDLGGTLFQSAFGGPVLELLRSSQQYAHGQEAQLRLQLQLDPPELAELPWEYLYDEDHRQFLALSVESPVIRYLPLPERATLKLRPPLRILVAIASPRDLPPLDVEKEWSNVRSALGDTPEVKLVRLVRPTLDSLQSALRQDDFHIFHFVGHGSFDRETREGRLMLEDDDGQPQPVPGQYLGEILHDERTLRLAVVNACEGAAFSGDDPFAGVAQAIVQKGVPAVIAMQTVITDEAAVRFARGLYSALADGYPVDAALAEARKSMFTAGNLIEWGAPVLFLRSKDGRILDVEMPRPKPEPAAAVQHSAVPAPETPVAVTRNSSEPRMWLAADNPPRTDWERAFASGSVVLGTLTRRHLDETSEGDLILAFRSLGNFLFGLGWIRARRTAAAAKKGTSLALEIETAIQLEQGISLDQIRQALPDFRLVSRGRVSSFVAVSPEHWAVLRTLILHHNPKLSPDALPPSTVPTWRRVEIEEVRLHDSTGILASGYMAKVSVRLRNRGNVVWNPGESWSLVCRWWPERSSAKPAHMWDWPFTLSGAVGPGETLALSSDYPLPQLPGLYQAEWTARTVTDTGDAEQEPATRIDSFVLHEIRPNVVEPPAEEPEAAQEPPAPQPPPSPQPLQPPQEPVAPLARTAPVVISQPVVLLSEPPPAERTMRIEVDTPEVTLQCGGRLYRSELRLDPERLLAAASPRDYGEALFDALFNPYNAEGYDSSTLAGYDWLRAQPGEGLRVQIEPRTPELQQRKWEYLVDPRDKDALPLAALQTTPFYRRWGNAQRPLATARPLRILAAIANPVTLGREQDDQGRPVNRRIAALARLDPDRERDILETALGRLREAGIADYLVLEPPVTLDAMREALQDGWHVLHLLAHGLQDANRYHLVLEDADRRHDFVPTKAFRDALAGGSLRLVVLASCQSAVPDTARSLGHRLLDSVPAVVAMQDEVRIDTAQLFTQVFYDRLARTGRVDMALARTRSALYDQGKEWQWGIPVLLMSTDDGRLFDVDEARAATELPEVEPRIKEYRTLAGAGASHVAPAALSTAAAAPASPEAEPLARPQERAVLHALKRVALNAGELKEAAKAIAGLDLPPAVYSQIASALNAGKHVILIGPPGTGKTSLAHAVCELASRKGFATGAALTTATADWTAFDTVGGYVPTAQQTLQFRSGVFLEAIRTGRWLVIDEINRAEIDKAFGELFTVLAGQQVDLPYTVGAHRVRVLPPAGRDPEAWLPQGPLAGYDYVMHPSWRILATMNVYDKSHLFTLSFAFMRRFAFVDVDLPGPETYQGLIDAWLQASHLAGDAQLVQTVREVLWEVLKPGNPLMSCRELGPAIVKDMIEYMSCRYEAQVAPMDLLAEALLLYVTPQLDGIDRDRIVTVRRFLAGQVGASGESLLRRVQSLYPHVRPEEWNP